MRIAHAPDSSPEKVVGHGQLSVLSLYCVKTR